MIWNASMPPEYFNVSGHFSSKISKMHSLIKLLAVKSF